MFHIGCFYLRIPSSSSVMYAQVNKKNKKHPSKPDNTQKQRPVSYTEVEIVTDKKEYVIFQFIIFIIKLIIHF